MEAEALIEVPPAFLPFPPLPAFDPDPAPLQPRSAIAAAPGATLNAGQIGSRLGFHLSLAFITDTLGVAPAGVDPKRKNVLWNEAQWPDIKAALVAHVGRLP